MNKRIKKKLSNRDNNFHYKSFKQLTEYLIFEHNDDGTLDVIYVQLTKQRRVRSAVKYVNCVPSSVEMRNNNDK